MRALIITVLIVFSLAACKSREAGPAETTAQPGRLRAAIQMGDPQTASQLVTGFHSVENNSWRWTERQFTVNLAPPRPSQNGGVLALKFTVPAAITSALQTITLSASIEGTELAPESYPAPGSYTYQRDIAPNLLTGESVRVGFRLDKALPPSGAEMRELGVIVQSVALSPK
jgi:hypothetical protein